MTVQNRESKSLFVSGLRHNEPNKDYLAARGYDRNGVQVSNKRSNVFGRKDDLNISTDYEPATPEKLTSMRSVAAKMYQT